jgi:glycosyltransferase involved in cell wall biosynthesis
VKVLHLISGGDTGGAKTAVLSLCEELSKHIQCDLVCFIKDTFYEEGKQRKLNIHFIEQKKRSDLTIIKRIKELIIKENYDLIHCHGARANFIGMFLKKKVNKTFVTTIHSDYRLDFKDVWYKQLLYMPLNSISLRFMDRYIAVSNSFKDLMIERGFKEEKISTVYNGIDITSNVEVMKRNVFLKKYGIENDNKIVVGMAARLDSVKNPDMFINMAYLALQKNDNIRFIIAGDGYEKEALQERINLLRIGDNVKLLGFVNDKYSFFNSIDINILTSNSESFPYVIMEGALMKKPVISTDVGGLRDLIKNDETGYLVPVADEEKMSELVLKLAEDEKLRIKIGKALNKKVLEKYTVEKMCETHINIYNSIIKEGK